MKPGDIFRIKYSGESVIALHEVDEPNGVWLVRRFVASNDGAYYEELRVLPFELETVEQNIDREFAEVLYRQQLMKKKLDEDVEINVADDGQIQ